jgi:nucleoside permease NupC
MKKIINNLITFLISLAGLIGGGIWVYYSNWELEPIILMTVSALQIIGFIILRFVVEPTTEKESKTQQSITNKKKVEKQINIQKNKGKIEM